MLENFEKITSITIPNYIREVEVSKKQNPKYFVWNGQTIKSNSKKLWKKCIDSRYDSEIIMNNGNVLPQHLKEQYTIFDKKSKLIMDFFSPFDTSKKWILGEITSEGIKPVIANPTQVGKPNTKIISGQYIYSGVYNKFMQGKIINEIKKSYYLKFRTIPHSTRHALKLTLDKSYPLLLIAEIQDTVKRFNDNTKEGNGKQWDVGNFAYPYLKTFSDFLVNGYITGNLQEGLYDIEPVIKEDDRLHIMGEFSYYTPIPEGRTRKLIFHLYKDTRTLWNPILNK